MDNGNAIDVKRTEIKTATVRIKTLVIDNRKFTLATFRQIPSIFSTYNYTERIFGIQQDIAEILGVVRHCDTYYFLFNSQGILFKMETNELSYFFKNLDRIKCYVDDLERFEKRLSILHTIRLLPQEYQLYIAT